MKQHRFLPLAVTLTFVAVLMTSAAFSQQSPSAANEQRLSELEDANRAMNGRVEQLEYAVRRQDTTLQRLQADFDARLQALEQRAAAPAPQAALPQTVAPQAQAVAPNSTEPPAALENPSGTLGALKMQNGRITGGIDNPQSPALPATPPDYGLTTQEQYDAAFALLRQADYDGAEKAFKSFIDKNPKDKLISNAKYWYGETLYVRGKLDESAVAFADAWQQDPQGPKAPDSLLKLAMSLAAIGKTPDACTALSELKVKYPSASPTIRSRATEETSKIKCPTR